MTNKTNILDFYFMEVSRETRRASEQLRVDLLKRYTYKNVTYDIFGNAHFNSVEVVSSETNTKIKYTDEQVKVRAEYFKKVYLENKDKPHVNTIKSLDRSSGTIAKIEPLPQVIVSKVSRETRYIKIRKLSYIDSKYFSARLHIQLTENVRREIAFTQYLKLHFNDLYYCSTIVKDKKVKRVNKLEQMHGIEKNVSFMSYYTNVCYVAFNRYESLKGTKKQVSYNNAFLQTIKLIKIICAKQSISCIRAIDNRTEHDFKRWDKINGAKINEVVKKDIIKLYELSNNFECVTNDDRAYAKLLYLQLVDEVKQFYTRSQLARKIRILSIDYSNKYATHNYTIQGCNKMIRLLKNDFTQLKYFDKWELLQLLKRAYYCDNLHELKA